MLLAYQVGRGVSVFRLQCVCLTPECTSRVCARCGVRHLSVAIQANVCPNVHLEYSIQLNINDGDHCHCNRTVSRVSTNTVQACTSAHELLDQAGTGTLSCRHAHNERHGCPARMAATLTQGPEGLYSLEVRNIVMQH